MAAGAAVLPRPRPSQTADADHPANEFTFSDAASVQTVREKIASPRGDGLWGGGLLNARTDVLPKVAGLPRPSWRKPLCSRPKPSCSTQAQQADPAVRLSCKLTCFWRCHCSQ